ncbi:MAG TPA: glycosyltransferase [Candidatus Blautia merdavium]|uniref:Glycosyltransferase n=1 Tax=Candidatus Blautia merdavium TaxID=2838494 RepID=A0A9D2PSP5_9FIRM|nr:glycosyltransferase [Candidatus Blautia merdavium]
MTVTVIIPTYRPGEKFRRLMESLKEQTYPIEKIIVMNTEKKFWKEDWTAGMEHVEVRHISKEEFDHGRTRKEAVAMADTDLFVCFTQDAVPADDRVVEMLVKAFDDPGTAAAYGRQLPDRDCKLIERYTRSFNYPERSCVKTKKDLKRLGIKTFFCSNVCAAYRKSVYDSLGGFISHTIFNEDMIMAGTMIKAGYGVAYAAEAKVVHSHNYTCIQQFRRNFDLAVSQADHPEIFGGIPSESEGIRLVKSTARYLVKEGKVWLIPYLVISSGFKFLGYRAGRAYQKLPRFLIKKFTMSPSYWKFDQEQRKK